MLRLLAQMGLLLGGIGVLSSYLDPDVATGAGDWLRKVSSMVKQSDMAGSDQTAVMTEKVADTIQNAAGSHGNTDANQSGNNAIAGRAFYNKLPPDCIGEKQIELEGKVHCDQGRRPARNR